MQVNIDEIREAGLDRAWDLSRESVDALLAGDPARTRARGALRGKVHLRKVHERVLADGEAEVDLTAPCRRCLAGVSLRVPVRFSLTYRPGAEGSLDGLSHREDRARGEDHEGRGARAAAHGTSGSFVDADVDEELYRGKVIDLDPALREQLLLALPTYPVCSEACKGLCPVCGQNLNERDCGCDRRVPDPRWAALEKLKNSKE